MSTTTTTEIFVDEINRQLNDAIMIGGQRGRKIVMQIADDLSNRRIAGYISDHDPAEVELTDEQWERLARDARREAMYCAESW